MTPAYHKIKYITRKYNLTIIDEIGKRTPLFDLKVYLLLGKLGIILFLFSDIDLAL